MAKGCQAGLSLSLLLLSAEGSDLVRFQTFSLLCLKCFLCVRVLPLPPIFDSLRSCRWTVCKNWVFGELESDVRGRASFYVDDLFLMLTLQFGFMLGF